MSKIKILLLIVCFGSGNELYSQNLAKDNLAAFSGLLQKNLISSFDTSKLDSSNFIGIYTFYCEFKDKKISKLLTSPQTPVQLRKKIEQVIQISLDNSFEDLHVLLNKNAFVIPFVIAYEAYEGKPIKSPALKDLLSLTDFSDRASNNNFFTNTGLNCVLLNTLFYQTPHINPGKKFRTASVNPY